MSTRTIVARGITANERGKSLTVDGQEVFLRNAEHFQGRTVLTVVTTIEVDPMSEVTVHE